MSITNYTELKTTVADWLMRDDLTARVPDFITFAEAYMNRKLRTANMVNRSRATATGRFLARPNDWREAVNIQRTSDEQFLEYRSMEVMDELRKKQADGYVNYSDGPRFYSIMGTELELFPSATTESPVEIEMVYYGKVPSLSASNTTNWLLTEAPDLYLYATLVHSAPYLKEDERTAVWTSIMGQLISDMNDEHERSKFSGSTLTRTVEGFEGT